MHHFSWGSHFLAGFVLLLLGSSTRTAHALFAVVVRVLGGELVIVLAVGTVPTDHPDQAFSSRKILGSGDQFHVIRVTADTNSTEMIGVQAVPRTYESLEHDHVNATSSPVPVDLSVTTPRLTRTPEPTARVGLWIDLRPDALRKTVVSVVSHPVTLS
jgi:hypothetical protein